MKSVHKFNERVDGIKRVIEWGLILIVAGSTFAFGGVVPLAISLMEVAVFILVLALVISHARQGFVRLPIPIALIPIIVFIVLQLTPLPYSIVNLISPSRGQIFTSPGLLSTPGWISLSIYPRQTFESLLKLLAYCGAFLLAAYVFECETRKSALIRALVLLGALEAAYGIVQYLTGFQRIFTFVKQYYREEATGTFINHNHFAGFLELTTPFLIVQIFYLIQLMSPPARPSRPRGFSTTRQYIPQLMVLVIMGVMMLMAMFFSRSRIGILSTIISFIFMALLGQLKMRGRKWLLATVFTLACAASYAVWIGVGPVLGRYELLTQAGYLESEGRLLLWRDGFRLVKDFPIVGTGLGTFAVAFRHYQTCMLQYFVDHIHSDYLEFLSELGIAGSVLLFAPILVLWFKIVRVFVTERSRYRRSVLLGCAGSMLAILVHTATDFNLQISANALVLAVILGIGYRVACLDVRAEETSLSRNRAPTRKESSGELAEGLKVRPA